MSDRARSAKLPLLTLLLALLFAFGRPAIAAPVGPPTAAHAALRLKRSVEAKARDRDERGRFLPKVSEADVQVRAYQKFEARNRSAGHVVDGHDVEDFLSAKRELQNEKSAKIRAAKTTKVLGITVRKVGGGKYRADVPNRDVFTLSPDGK